MFQDLEVEVETPVLQELARRCATAWLRHIRLDPEAIPTLEAARSRGHATALVSNFDHPPYVHELLDEMALRPHFDAVVVSGEVGCKKPDPRIFDFALEATGLQPHEVLHVGDTEDDVNGALAAGIRPVLIRRPGSPPLEEAALSGEVTVIASLAELLPLTGE